MAEELSRAIEVVDQLLTNAMPIPLTAEVRIPRSDLEAGVAGIEAAAATSGITSDPEIVKALKDVERLASRAKPVPLTDQVRVNRKKAGKAIERLRAALSAYGWS